MKLPVDDLFVKSCRKCGYPVLLIIPKGPNLTLRCVQCDASNANASKVDAGVKERDGKSVRDAIAPRIRNEVRMRAGGKCELCGVSADQAELHISHLISVDDGLRFEIPNSILNCPENLALFCNECNGDMSSETVPLRIAVIITAIRNRRQMRNFQSVITTATEGIQE